MTRPVVYGALLILCFLLQTTLTPWLLIAGVFPNILLVFVLTFAQFRGSATGLVLGFFSGLLWDLMFGSIVGYYALLYMLLGYLAGFASRLFFEYDLKMALLIFGAGDLLLGLTVYVTLFLMQGRFQFFAYLRGYILPETVYTLGVSVIFYSIFYLINNRLCSLERKKEGYFAG